MKKLLSIFVTAIIAISIMSIGVCASENEASVVLLNGEGTGVSSTLPLYINDEEIIPFGTSKPSYGVYHSLNNGPYSGSVDWMGATLYSNKWFGTSTSSIRLDASMRFYSSIENATNRYMPLLNTSTVTTYRLVGSDGSTTPWKQISNSHDGSVVFSVEPDMTYCLEMYPPTGGYVGGTFTLTRQ